MMLKFLLTAGVVASLATGAAFAQPATTNPAPVPNEAPMRSPVAGDVGTTPTTPSQSASELAREDKQPAGTENGNQPDRAASGGGAR